jgi:hypothetical protein
MEKVVSAWYQETKLGDSCTDTEHCPDCEPNGDCEPCGTIDGRVMEMVNEYASTCDGECHELTSHENLKMDPVTQLGYCTGCIPLLPEEIRNRLMSATEDD